MVRTQIGIAGVLAQQFRRIALTAVVVELEKCTVLEIELLQLRHRGADQRFRFLPEAVPLQPSCDQVVDIDPDRAAPHILAVELRLAAADRWHRKRRREPFRILQRRHQPLRHRRRRCPRKQRQESRRTLDLRPGMVHHVVIDVQAVFRIPQPLVHQHIQPLPAPFPESCLRRKPEAFRELRHDFAILRQIGVEVAGVQLHRGVEPRGVVHPALAAAAVSVTLDLPLDQPAAVGVAVGEDPLEVGGVFPVMAPQPFVIPFQLVQQLHAESEDRRLGDLARLQR